MAVIAPPARRRVPTLKGIILKVDIMLVLRYAYA